MIDSSDLNQLIESGIKDTIQQNINTAIEKIVEQKIKDLQQSSDWIEQLQNSVHRSMVQVLQQTLSTIDIKQEIATTIFENKETIGNVFKKDFSTLGIKDTASHNQLTVMDGAVVVESEFYTNDLTSERSANFKGECIINGDLVLNGTVNVDNASWNELSEHISSITLKQVRQDFEQGTLDKITQLAYKGIDAENVSINGELLIAGSSLANTITESNLQHLGDLEKLSVKNTLVAQRGRLGINTESPTDTLSIWDEEVNIIAGKHSKNTAFIGTNKDQDLVIGTNKQKQLTVNADGGVTVDSLTVGKNKLTFANSVPNYSGTKGDMVFNRDIKPGQPFAWVCLGTFRWQGLHAS